MSKTRKTVFGIWTFATVLLLIIAWVQTTRLTSVTQEREQLRTQAVTALLREAASLLDEAARQAENRNLGNAEGHTSSALGLLETVRDSADKKLVDDVESRMEAVKAARGMLISGDDADRATGALRLQAAEVRSLTELN